MIDNNSIFPLILSSIAGLSTVLGTLIIFITKKNDNKILTFALGFSGGVMLTVSLTNLFPTAEAAISKYHGSALGILWSLFFLLIGALISYLIDIFIPTEEKGVIPQNKNNSELFRLGLVSTIALMIHNFPEGIATFVSGYQDISLGITVTFAIALHNIPEGIAIAVPIYYATKSYYQAIKYSFISGLAEPLGAFIAFLFLKPFINELILGIIFAIVSGIMLYISLNELIPSSRKYNHPNLSIFSILLGIIIIPLSPIFF